MDSVGYEPGEMKERVMRAFGFRGGRSLNGEERDRVLRNKGNLVIGDQKDGYPTPRCGEVTACVVAAASELGDDMPAGSRCNGSSNNRNLLIGVRGVVGFDNIYDFPTLTHFCDDSCIGLQTNFFRRGNEYSINGGTRGVILLMGLKKNRVFW